MATQDIDIFEDADADTGVASRIESFLKNIGRGREDPQWKIDLREQVARGEADPALLTMGIDPLDKAGMLEAAYGPGASPTQTLWGAGLFSGLGGVADALGFYPVPQSRNASIYEMVTGPKSLSANQNLEAGHPVIAGLQTMGAAFPGLAVVKAGAKPLQKGVGALSRSSKGIGNLDANTLDLLEEINLSGGAQIDDMGNVTLYHRTTPAAASKIKETGVMTGKEDRLFFSTKPDRTISSYGSEVVEVKVPINKLQLDDIFENEAHLTLKTDFKPTNVNVISEIDEGIGALPRGADEGSSVIDASSDVASALADQRALKEGIASLDAPALGPEALNRASFIYDDAPPTFKPGSRKLIDAGEELQREALNVWGGKPMAMTDENSLIVANNMTDEARESYRRRPEMAGWYKDNLDRAVKSASEIHPELATDPEALTAFKVVMAITSNGQEVPLNAKLTNQFYTAYKKNGRFLVAGSGKEANAMKKGFENANAIVDDIGFAGFQDFLSREFTVRDLKQAGFNVSGENVDTIVNGSIIFGPKIGGGFMQNLMGNYKPATFDRWWQRTYGRHTGTLIAAPEKVAKQRDAFRAAIGRKRELVESFGFDIKEVMADDEVLDQFANVVHRKFASGGYKDKSPINNTSRNLGKSLTNLEDAPRGGNQRNFMRKTITQVRDNLRAEGIDIDTADVQALLWYAEKDLYGKMGARVNTTRVDYATVWKEIAAAHAASR